MFGHGRMPRSKTDQFWQYGIEAILWASYAKTDDDRQGLLELARTWTQAALQERASLVDHERDRCRVRTPQLAASSFSCRKAEKNANIHQIRRRSRSLGL
jgi:hypothetical protein